MAVDAARIRELMTRGEAPLATGVDLLPRRGQRRPALGPVDVIERYLVRQLGERAGREALAWLIAQPDVRMHRTIDLNAAASSLRSLLRGGGWTGARSANLAIPTAWFAEHGRELPDRSHIPTVEL
jgi:hypothetical protein